MKPGSCAVDVFGTCFDVIILGQGHAGWAAAQLLHQTGKQVLMVGEQGDLLWESGRAAHPDAGACDHPLWQAHVKGIEDRHATYKDQASGRLWLDHPQAEALAADALYQSGMAWLFYARPTAVQMQGQAIASLIVATKSGLRRVCAQQWIDATEDGVLATLVAKATKGEQRDQPLLKRQPSHLAVHLYLQHADWSSLPALSYLSKTAWPTERVMSLQRPVDEHAQFQWRLAIPAALQQLADDLGDDVGAVSMTYMSMRALPVYDAAESAASATSVASPLASNFYNASPSLSHRAIHTLADRFALGIESGDALVHSVRNEKKTELQTDVNAATAAMQQPLPAIEPDVKMQADVVIVGAGTGGAPAAIAAGKTFRDASPGTSSGAKVVCLENAYYVGGVGTAGGIHSYYFGIPGGLQLDIDRRVRDLMFRFRTPQGDGPFGDGPFNPWAKQIALGEMLAEQHVELLYESQPFAVHMQGRKVTWMDIATPQGVVRLTSPAWVDATGDGDLCAMAGAGFNMGREHDGLTHAYSQPCGVLRQLHGRPRLRTLNFDAGFVDPTDPQDFSRARIAGVRLHCLNEPDNDTRPLYITPAIGLRQSRHIHTRYTLTLDDQIMRRSFPDCIGYSGSHYDNHATDYEFESDEGMFWVWVNEQFLQHFSHEICFGMLVPQALDNVVIASRCVGVTQDAHHSMRMQRDMQRLGEAAGYASALAVFHETDTAHLPFELLREKLAASGALDRHPRIDTPVFGTMNDPEFLEKPAAIASADVALAALDQNELGPGLWWLYKNQQHVEEQIVARLNHADANISWLAACVAAMWGDERAQPRLLRAIQTHELGYEEELAEAAQKFDATGRPLLGTKPVRGPMYNPRHVPRWLAAAALLRRAGTVDSLEVLAELVDRPVHAVNTLTTVALTISRLRERIESPDEGTCKLVVDALEKMAACRLISMKDYPQRWVGKHAHDAIAGKHDELAADTQTPQLAKWGSSPYENSPINNHWQLELAISKAKAAWGIGVVEKV